MCSKCWKWPIVFVSTLTEVIGGFSNWFTSRSLGMACFYRVHQKNTFHIILQKVLMQKKKEKKDQKKKKKKRKKILLFGCQIKICIPVIRVEGQTNTTFIFEFSIIFWIIDAILGLKISAISINLILDFHAKYLSWKICRYCLIEPRIRTLFSRI